MASLDGADCDPLDDVDSYFDNIDDWRQNSFPHSMMI